MEQEEQNCEWPVLLELHEKDKVISTFWAGPLVTMALFTQTGDTREESGLREGMIFFALDCIQCLDIYQELRKWFLNNRLNV